MNNVIYVGYFFNADAFNGTTPAFSDVPSDIHITVKHRNNGLSDEEWQKICASPREAEFSLVGYGKNETNEGFSVRPLNEVAYFGAPNMHITRSFDFGKGGRAVKTAEVNMTQPVPEGYPEKLVGRLMVVVDRATGITQPIPIDEFIRIFG